MKKLTLIMLICVALMLCACGKTEYKDKKVTEKNYATIFKEENNLTEEEKELLTLGITQYAFDIDGIYGKKIGELIEEGRTVKAQKEEEENKPEKKLSTIRNEFVTELWNEVFCNISWYVAQGTNTTGEELDIEYILRKADKLMEKRDEYDQYINSLSDDKYSEIKYIWKKLIAEIDRMYARIKEETPRPNDSTYEYSTGNFDAYSSDFQKEIKRIKE